MDRKKWSLIKKMACVCLIFAPVSKVCSSLPEPYASVKQLPEYPFAQWYANAASIEEIFRKNDIKVVVEVGSWVGGGSTRHMAGLLKNKAGARLYAVDTWLGSSENQPGERAYDPILGKLYQQFLSNMIWWNLADIVIPCRMRSLEAASVLNVKPDLVYIDGEHTTSAVLEDLQVWYPFIKEGGILCGDDWAWGPVAVAVKQFASQNGLVVQAADNFWRLVKAPEASVESK